jgi:tryptophanyl-tRNA synthetase
MHKERVLSGMRTTGELHLGHYHGVLKNWLALQHQYDCVFLVADWHALTTHYDDTRDLADHVIDNVITWLSVGINPSLAHIAVQSRIPEHAVLHLLLSMITPLSWLERVPTYKEQQLKLNDKDLSTYGFLGYPLLQAADILTYKASLVPVGEDQVPHIEFAREVARRFNHIYGRDPGFVEKAHAAFQKLGTKQASVYESYRREFQEQGNELALEKGRALIESQTTLSLSERERLLGYLEGAGKIILPEPKALLTPAAKIPGLDGQKMSKSYNNVIRLRDEPEQVEQKIRTMPTDPARVRRTDPGTPEKCPVWNFHKIYSDEATQEWAHQGCRTASIGCIDCKKPVIQRINEELAPIQAKIREYEGNTALVRNIIVEGTEAAQEIAANTLEEVQEAMGLSYF